MRLSRPIPWPRPATLTGLVLVLLPVATALWVHTASAAQQTVDAAIDLQRDRIAQDPSSAEAYNDLGNLLALRQDREAAEEAYREAIRLDPEFFSAHFNLGVLLRTGHRPGEALEVLERATELEPSSAWAHYQSGAAHQALSHRKKATNAYARAFALDNRLALPDVNPLVIGNPLVTAAMLTRQDVPLADTSPRSYADPVTISQLLQPPATPDPATPEDGAEEESSDATAPSPNRTLAAPANGQPPGAPTVGEVRPPATASPSPRRPAPSAGADSGEPPQVVAPQPNDRRITTDDIRSLRVLNQAAPQPGATPPPQGGNRDRNLQAPQRFRPGRRSSAQLDLELVPGSRPAAVSLTRL